MRKALRLVLVTGATAAMLVGTVPAHATHDLSTAACTIDGEVDIRDFNGGPLDPISGVREIDWFEFIDVNLTCTGSISNTTVVNEPFVVTADGGSTGILSADGESCDDAQDLDNGHFEADGPGATDVEGDVDFIRVGSIVYAWGELRNNNVAGAIGGFDTVLQFTPTPPDDAVGCTDPTDATGVDEASLIGPAAVTDHAVWPTAHTAHPA